MKISKFHEDKRSIFSDPFAAPNQFHPEDSKTAKNGESKEFIMNSRRSDQFEG